MERLEFVLMNEFGERVVVKRDEAFTPPIQPNSSACMVFLAFLSAHESSCWQRQGPSTILRMDLEFVPVIEVFTFHTQITVRVSVSDIECFEWIELRADLHEGLHFY